MAKKKADETENEPVELDFNKRMSDEIERDYGAGHLFSGDSVISQKRDVIPICPSLDIITSGGILSGSWVSITGAEKIGKSVAALTIAANAQKPEYGNRVIVYGDVEHRLTAMHLNGIRGLDTSKKKLIIVQSSKEKIFTSIEWLTIFQLALTTIPGCVLVIDSLSVLCDEKIMTNGIGTETRGGGNRWVTQFVETMAPVVPINDCVVIGITRQIANTSGFGAAKVEKVANAWKYQMDYQLRGIKRTPWKSGERQIGQVVEWACGCSKLGPPGMRIESYLRYGTGYDRLYESLYFGMTIQLIKKAGSWLTFDFLVKNGIVTEANVPKVQGGEAAYRLLIQNPEWAKLLESEVLKSAGLLAGGSNED